MKTINYLIVELDEAYDNEVDLSTGDSIIINSTIESVANINRVATVKKAPDFTILQEGDQVVVHHNIFRKNNDINGNQADSHYHIENNLYFVPLTEVFMYKRSDSDWNAISPYCFVEPVYKKKKEGFDLNAIEDTYKGRIPKRGIMRYPNEELLKQGLKNGDVIIFSKNSEYEFIIDGVLYYKMSTKDILAAI